MKAVVTGGAGFIGSHVVDCLLEYGWDVDVLDNLRSGTRDNLNPHAKFHHFDITSRKLGGKLFALQPHAIFHLAAQADVPTSIRAPLLDLNTNTVGTIRVLEAAKNLGAKLVFASTGGAIYGECGYLAARETDLAQPLSPYAVSKLAAEHYLLAWNELYGMENVILRYSNVYGPRQSAKAEGGVVAIFKDRIDNDMSCVVYGDGKQTRDFIHVRDVKTATVSAANLPAGVYNIGTSVETSILELLELLEVKEWEHEPRRTGDLLHSVLDTTKIRENLVGWKGRPINETLLQ